MKPLNMDDVYRLAEQKNLICLDSKYVKAGYSMKWQCKKCNYIWNTSYNNLTKSQGCNKCKGRAKHTLLDIKKLAFLKGYMCLDSNYINNITKMRWKCLVCDYVINSTFSSFTRRKKQCPKCNKLKSMRYDISTVKEICAKKNIECLENKYKNYLVPMKWRCLQCKREWSTSFSSILHNIGCLKCSIDKRRLGIEKVYNYIEKSSITCLSTNYINNSSKLLFKCDICNNKWEASFHHIKDSNSGCPNCASFKSERLCRELFQTFMGCNFPKRRPSFLEKLELDGYCEELKLAFEYHGIQHFKHNSYFHTEEQFNQRQERDLIKRNLCKKHNITLIEIPYIYDHKNKNKLEEYILHQLIETNFICLIEA